MLIKKLFRTMAAVTLISVLFVMPVSAHGHHHSQRASAADTGCPVCTVEGCTEEGRHTHDGHEYCGYDHADSYCDGSCETATVTAARSRHGRHHSCH